MNDMIQTPQKFCDRGAICPGRLVVGMQSEYDSG